MKKLFLTLAVLAASVAAQAQAPAQVNASAVPGKASDDVASLSAQLKEAYGILSQDLAHLGREIGPDATKATPEQAAMRERMQNSLKQLEGMLTTVNSPDAINQWADVKAKAEMVRGNAMAIVEERKAKR